MEALVTDKSGNTTRLRRSVQVMDYSGMSARPIDPTRAPSFDVIVSGSLESARPDTLVKVQFSEPVKNVSQSTLRLEKLVDSAWISLDGTSLRLGELEQGKTLLAWILPANLLELDGHYRVVADATITDWDPDPKVLVQAPVEFHVQAHVPLGSVAMTARKVVSMGRTVFAVDRSERMHMLLAMDYGLSEQKVFGEFQGQGVDAMVAFENAQVAGMKYPGLLLVTTTPGGAAYTQNAVLWGFEFCAGSGDVNPLFSISLGPSMSGYAPGVDYRSGVIAVSRLTGSVALIRLEDAIAKAPANGPLAVSPGGFGQGAIFQPFYLSDPDYQFKEGTTTRASSGSNYGVALSPVNIEVGGQQYLRTVVAYGGDLTAQLKNVPIAGLPSFWLPYTAGATYKPVEPFVADADSQAISRTRFAAPASAYATTGLVAGGAATHMVQLWADANVWIGGTQRKTNLAIGIANMALAPGGGNSLVVMDVNTTDTSGQTKVWLWPQVSPFGANVGYEIQYRKASLDPATGLCAVEVKNLATGKMSWFILDLTRPENPPVVDTFLDSEGAGWSGSLSYGIFSATNGTGVSSWRVMGVQGGGQQTQQVTPFEVVTTRIETPKPDKSIAGIAPISNEVDKVESGKNPKVMAALPKSINAQTLARLASREESTARVRAALDSSLLGLTLSGECKPVAKKKIKIRIVVQVGKKDGAEAIEFKKRINDLKKYYDVEWLGDEMRLFEVDNLIMASSHKPDILIVASHGTAIDVPYWKFLRDENNAVLKDEAGNVRYDKDTGIKVATVYGIMARGLIAWRRYYPNIYGEIGHGGAYQWNAVDPIRLGEHLPGEIQCNNLLFGVCNGDRIYNDWKPRVVSTNAEGRSRVATVRGDYSDDNRVVGKIKYFYLLNAVYWAMEENKNSENADLVFNEILKKYNTSKGMDRKSIEIKYEN